MARKLLSQPFERGATETWQWNTDILTNVERGEQRICLREYPDEVIGASMGFGDDGQEVFDDAEWISGQDAIVRNLADNVQAEGEVEVPLWWLCDTRVAASFLSGSQIAQFTFSATTCFFAVIGEEVLVEFDDAWLRAEVTDFDESAHQWTVDFGENIGSILSQARDVVPLRTGLAKDGAGMALGRAAHTDDTSVTVLLDRSQGRVGMSGGVTLSTDTPGGLPLITYRGIQDSFDLAINPGLSVIETATGFPYYVTHWDEVQFQATFRDVFDRYRQGDRFRYWRTLFATLRGSQGTFWLPTRRGEFTVLSSDNDAQNIVLEGPEYFNLWSTTNLEALCLDSLAGDIVVRQVTGVELDGDDSVLEFGDDWFAAPVLQCSLALPCRIDGDSVTWSHQDQTSLEFKVVSVVYEFPLPEEVVDWDGLLARIDGSASGATFDSSGRYVSIPISGELGGEVTVSAGSSGAQQSPQNGLRAMAFEDAPFDPSADTTLHIWTDTLLAQFRYGTVPADCQFQGYGEVPRVFILPGDPVVAKPLGVARYVTAWTDIDEPLIPSRVTAPTRSQGTFSLKFAAVDYFSPDFTPQAVGMNDRSGGARHLTTSAEFGLTAERTDPDERYGIWDGPLDTATFSALPTTSKMLAIVGHVDALPASAQSLARLDTAGTDYVVRLNTGGAIHLNRGSASATVGDLDAGDWYLLLCVFNGASSSIHLLKNDSPTWVSATVDDGGGSFDGVTAARLGWGSDEEERFNAFLVGEIPADLVSYREGLARYYGFESNVSQTGMQAATTDIDGWKVLHDGSADYVLSFPLRIDEPGPDSITLWEILNDAENGGLRCEWDKSSNEMTLTYVGVAGTFAETFDLTTFAGDSFIPELRFTAATGGSAALYVNGASQGAFTPTGFTYSAVQQNVLTFGTERGWTLYELTLREGSGLYYTTLADKWDIDV